MATLREGWVMPTKKIGVCPECGKGIGPKLYQDSDDTHLSIQCDLGCTWEQVDWPFVEPVSEDSEDMPTLDDFEALGFEMV